MGSGRRSTKEGPAVEAARRAILDDLDEAPGLRRTDVLAHLKRLLVAKRRIFAQHDGQFTDEREVEDHAIQLGTLREVLQLRGEYPAKNVSVEASVRVESLADRLVELGRLEEDGAIGRGHLLQIAGLDDTDVIPTKPLPPDAA